MSGRTSVIVIGILGAIVLLVVIGIAWSVSIRNGIIRSDETIQAASSEVLNQYKRRTDLVPNLVETVKGYMAHEQETLTRLTEMRAKVGQMNVPADVFKDPEAFQRFLAAQSEIRQGIGRLLAVAENYPDLKASQQFKDLMVQLEGTENRIAFARTTLIRSINEYNVRVRTFPGSMFGFPTKEQVTFPDEDLKPVKVEFGK
jgi:LemA protein